MNNKKVAIMQPYLFPYLGYFQLIQAADLFVFYDDVNFIKRGWINRNRILFNGKDKLISIPLKKASQNKLIHEIEINYGNDYNKILKTIQSAYQKAPYYKEIIEVIEGQFLKKYDSIAEMASESILAILDFLDLRKDVYKSSHSFPDSKEEDKADRLIYITKKLGATHYINPSGGKGLYNKSYFKKNGIELCFMENNLKAYKQFNKDFINGLSIIDVLMFNDKGKVLNLLQNFQLI